VVLALDTADGDYDYEDLTAELNGRTIHLPMPEGGQAVGREVIHGERR
jgi:hypothetical protein